jgi:hypothetical protein
MAPHRSIGQWAPLDGATEPAGLLRMQLASGNDGRICPSADHLRRTRADRLPTRAAP